MPGLNQQELAARWNLSPRTLDDRDQAIGGTHGVPYLAVVAVYVIADVATPIRHVPGGLGIIESVVLTFLPGEIVVGGFIVFSVTYYFVPLLGAIMVALSELPLPQRRISTQS
jgi:uncharacterized membrane protein YbhN (UPF0104 family)